LTAAPEPGISNFMPVRKIFAFVILVLLSSCVSRPQPVPIWVGGLPVTDVVLPESRWDDSQFQIRRVQLIPGRGLNTHQIWAHVPGKGEVALLASDPIESIAASFSGSDHDRFGNQSFFQGGPWMIPFANRIRGKVSDSGDKIEVQARSQKWSLDANWAGSKVGSEPHAMHGLLLKAPFDLATNDVMKDGTRVFRAEKKVGNFNERWLGDLLLVFQMELNGSSVVMKWQAVNVGKTRVPVGMGWHPFFRIPSGDRSTARLEIPAERRALTNNYNDVFPTGRVVRVEGTDFDFRRPKALGNLFLDDAFTGLQRSTRGQVLMALEDPKFGTRTVVTSTSPSLFAIQVYAPVDKAFVAIEPQTNLADPFSRVWGQQKTGMLWLKPGQILDFKVELKVESLGG
jgi:galactose mutarotase-like enzyme